ncbi:MAG: oligogalacturonate lyase family protein [Prolixibacteraceae bacterium]|jgi:oligogalacturonide lyase
MKQINFLLLIFILTGACQSKKLPVIETGSLTPMPSEWIDKDTGHRIVKLTDQMEGNSLSFYFHNNPFIGNEMVFYNSSKQNPDEVTDMKKEETYNTNVKNKQLYSINLGTRKITQLTFSSSPMNGEIVSAKTKTIFYQVKDSVFSVDFITRKVKLVYVFPEDFKASITTVNADGTLLGGSRATDAEKEILKNNPNKSDFFNLIYEAKLPKTLFTVNVQTDELNKLFTDSAWLNHVQFSSVSPDLLMFCHEGPWHKVDRVWTIDVNTKQVTQIHHRTIDREIWGHEWFGKSGKTIWFDLQQPRGETFFVGAYDVATGNEIKYSLPRNDWSVHYNTNSTETLFAGDGGDSGSVAKAPDGQWINLFTPDGDKFKTEKLVNMAHHKYKLEPNVHFSPDDKWIIFRANFEGESNIYAVEIEKSGN